MIAQTADRPQDDEASAYALPLGAYARAIADFEQAIASREPPAGEHEEQTE